MSDFEHTQALSGKLWEVYGEHFDGTNGHLNLKTVFPDMGYHYKDETALRLSYLHNGNLIPGKTVFILRRVHELFVLGSDDTIEEYIWHNKRGHKSPGSTRAMYFYTWDCNTICGYCHRKDT